MDAAHKERVASLRRTAQEAMSGKLHKHDEVHKPVDYDGTYRVVTDNEAVYSLDNGNLMNDTAGNAFVASFNRRMKEKKNLVRMLYTHFYLIPGSGSIRTGYEIPVICDRFTADIEREVEGGLLGLELILVPINIPGHWKLGVIDLKNRRFEMCVVSPMKRSLATAYHPLCFVGTTRSPVLPSGLHVNCSPLR